MAYSLAGGLQSLTCRTALHVSRRRCIGRRNTLASGQRRPGQGGAKYHEGYQINYEYHMYQAWTACRSICHVCIPWNFAQDWTLLFTVCYPVWRRCVSCQLKPLLAAFAKLWKATAVEPRFTNAHVHEQFGSRTNFPSKNVSDDELSRMTNCLGLRTRKLATAASWEYRRGSVSCWLTNLVSVYEHFGLRTASRNELSSRTEVPLY
jgi:hypothetical protein